ncbi:MAG: hypothetical protein [Wendovervirus sonii]|uniref:Uncharacterized protein n=1 Tax=phage Lak_Megaphage_Sonny TaxID=3109229 RepID=A0ABZ0Z373_9CAUD|nr:MAG: hypothetical protein [phage Lak_Megaphage_Sonny]
MENDFYKYAICHKIDLNRFSYLYENLNEGLIKSYDIRDVKKYFENEMNFDCIESVSILDKNIYFSRRKQISENDFVQVSIKHNPKSLIKYNEIVNVCYRLLGWFTGGIQVDVKRKDGKGFMSYVFMRGEPYKKGKIVKDVFFSEDCDAELSRFVFDNLYQICGFSLIIEEKFPIKQYRYDKGETFYHITHMKHLEKIKNIGLVPKSRFNYPSRIYLTNNIEYLDDFDYDMQNSVILKIRLKRGQKLYVDPRCEGFFTYDNISPDEIEILQLTY